MKTVILTTILILSLLFPAASLADTASVSQDVTVTIPPRMELDSAVLAGLETNIPLGKDSQISDEVRLRSNTSWFVKTTTLTSLDKQVQNDTTFTGQSNADAARQSVTPQIRQQASWSDDKTEEALVIYALSPGF